MKLDTSVNVDIFLKIVCYWYLNAMIITPNRYTTYILECLLNTPWHYSTYYTAIDILYSLRVQRGLNITLLEV